MASVAQQRLSLYRRPVERVDEYQALAHKLGADAFASRFPHPFLLKAPSASQDRAAESAGQIPYRTSFELVQEDPFANEWRVAPIRKRPENPFPERLTLGRARNCDVVIRVPFVSKVHAHFLVDGPALALTCLKDGGVPLLHEGRALALNESVPISLGDTIELGALRLRVVSPEELRSVLLGPRAVQGS